MSTLEKNLYKRITIAAKPQKESVGSAYRGFSTVNNTVEGFALYDFELIKQDIVNHFHIRQGEKLSDPKFGTIIWDMLFEPFTDDNKDAIIQNVTDIVNFDPRVTVQEVFVDTYDSGIEVSCLLSYLPYNISEQLLFKFDQESVKID
jgi:phage baseplate assembly protein W